MGNYASQTDVENAISTTTLAQLTADAGGAVDSTVAALEINLAEAQVDSCLATRIATPVNLTLFPDMANWLKKQTLGIAIWRLYHRRKIRIPAVEDEYKEATQALADFASGEKAAPGDVAPTSTSSTAPRDSWLSDTLAAGRTNMAGL